MPSTFVPAASTPSIFLGLDLSTQSLSITALSCPTLPAILDDDTSNEDTSNLEYRKIENLTNSSNVIWSTSVNYSSSLPTSSGITQSGITQSPSGTITQSVSVYLHALDVAMSRMSEDGVMSRMIKHVKAIGGGAQQHGAVYWSGEGEKLVKNMNEEGRSNQGDGKGTKFQGLEEKGAFSRTECTIWMDSSTTSLCSELNSLIGEEEVRSCTGASFTPRFTGPQIGKFAREDKECYKRTERIQLISTFLTSMLVGYLAPADYADSSGQNLLNLRTLGYDKRILSALDPTGSLHEKLSKVVPSCTVVGKVGGVLRSYGFNEECKVIAITGDNPATACSMNLGTASAALSLGTSDTLMTTFSDLDSATSSGSFTFPNPTKEGTFINMTCCTNGGTVRAEACEMVAGGDWNVFDRIISEGCGGGGGNRWLMKCITEETSPNVPRGIFRSSGGGWKPEDEVFALILTRIMHLCIKSPSGISRIMLAGGGSRSPATAQLIADVFGAEVWHAKSGSSGAASFGGALMALHGYACEMTRAKVEFSDIAGKIAEAGWEVWKTPDGAMEDFYSSLKDDYKKWENAVIDRGGRM